MAIAGRVAPKYKGGWSDSATYDVLDVVKYQGVEYWAKQGSSGQTPPTATEEDSYWAKMFELPVDMLGASSLTAGVHGLVPAPAAGDEDKYLKGDGTWAEVQGGGASNLPLYEFEESPTHKAHALNDKLFFDLKPYHLTVSSLAVSSLLIKPGNTGANIAEDLTAGEDYGVVGIPNT